MKRTFTNQQIAEHQLERAIRLYKDGDSICAITLAHAAEENLAILVRRKGSDSAFDEMVATICGGGDAELGRSAIQRLSAQRQRLLRKSLSQLLLNKGRNELTHGARNGAVSGDFDELAHMHIFRAVANLIVLVRVGGS